MSDTDPSTSLVEKEILRQREIEAQRNNLRSPAPNTRAAAVRRLGDLQAEVSELLDALHDPSEIVRAAAAMALGNFQNDPRAGEIAEYLLAAIDDSSERVCQSAIRSLGMLQAKDAREEIESFLGDPNPYILGSAILALARLGAGELAEEMVANIHHESLYVQMQTVRAAALLGYTPVGPDLIRLLGKVRAARQSAGFSDPSASRDRQSNDLYNLQNQLIRAAGELRLIDAIPILMETAQKDIGFRGLAIEALITIGAEIDPHLLARLLDDPGVNLRKRLLALFAQHDYRPALPLMRPLLNEENFVIRAAALQALTQMGDHDALPRIAWICSHDSNPFLRVQAVQSLVTLKGPSALPELLPLAEDANFQVRRTAVAYLSEWKDISEPGFRALAQFAVDFPEDTLSPAIQALLKDCGYDQLPIGGGAIQPVLILPAALEGERSQIITLLETWRTGLEGTLTRDQLEIRSAVDLLLGMLRMETPSS